MSSLVSFGEEDKAMPRILNSHRIVASSDLTLLPRRFIRRPESFFRETVNRFFGRLGFPGLLMKQFELIV